MEKPKFEQNVKSVLAKVLPALNQFFSALWNIIVFTFYPAGKFRPFFFQMSVFATKFAAKDQNPAHSMFHETFNKIMQAKIEERSVAITPPYNHLGGVIGTFRVSNMIYNLLLVIVYFIAGIAVPMAVIAYGATLNMSNYQGSTPMGNALLVLGIALAVYYFFFVIPGRTVAMLDTKINQPLLREFMQFELAYVYSKSLEVDAEVAEAAINSVAEAVMLNERNQIEDSQKLLQVFTK